MSLFHNINHPKAPEELNLIVEISEGDSNKYEYNGELGVLELDRVLYGPNYYPVNYCDVPQTWNEGDDDPLDAVLFSTHPIVPGALVQGRVIGVMEMQDNNEEDYKIVCVAAKDPRYADVKTCEDLTEYQKKDIKTFFETYKIPQTGKGTVTTGDFLPPEKAYEIIHDSIEAYKKKFSK